MVKKIENYKDRKLVKCDVLPYAKKFCFLPMDISGQ